MPIFRTAIPNNPATKSAATSTVRKSAGTVPKEPLSRTAGSKMLQKLRSNVKISCSIVNCSQHGERNLRAIEGFLPKRTHLAPAKTTKQAVKPTNASMSAKTGHFKKLSEVTESHSHKRNLPTFTKLNTSSENEQLLKEPPNDPAGQVMLNGNLPKLGLNQLIIVSCQEKQQVYCQLCSVRLRTSSHPNSFTHCYNYVKIKFPGWTENVSNLEDKLKEIVVHLLEIEKTLGSQKPQRMEVNKELYLKLAAVSEEEAVEKLKAIVRQDSGSSSSTDEIVAVSQQKVQSSCKVSSSDDGGFSRFPDNCTSNLESESLCQIRRHVKGEECKVSQAGNLIQDRPQESVNCNKMDPDYAPGIKAEDKKQGGRVKMRQTGMGTKSKHEAALAEHIASKSPLIASFGRKAPGCSNLSLFLQVSKVDIKKVIGIDSVWECRGICLETFFLCESCEETIPRRDVCQHMASFNHQLKYMCKNHPEFLELFWLDEDLPKALKINILHEVVWRLAERDRMFRKDAKCITLEKKLHRFVRTAQFNEALKTVWILVHEEPMIPLPFSNAQQFNAEENAKSTVEQEISFIGTSKIARDFIPVELNSVSKTDQVGGSVPNPGVYTKPDFFLKPGMKSSIPEAQKLVPESKFLPAVKKTLKVSVRGPSRKRPADSAVETLHKTNGSLNDPLPDKCTLGQRESNSPALVSPAVNVAAGSSLLAVKAEDFKPEQGD